MSEDEIAQFSCEHCSEEGLEIKEYCDECGEGPLCVKCKKQCEWNHSPAGQRDRHEDMKLQEWKERDLK